MAIFDESAPADNTKAGLGAKVVREEIKAVFNAKFEGAVVEVIDAAWECVKGWPRVYYAAAASAPTPAGNADQGRVWFVSDLLELRGHDGSNWIRMSAPCDMRIPLYHAPASVLTNASYAVLPVCWRYDSATATWGGMNWGSGKGVAFNKANAPAGSTIKLVVTGSAEAGSQAKVKLYDVGAAADVSGSEVTLTTAVEEVSSGDLTSAITAGNRILQVYAKAGTAAYYSVGPVQLRIQKA